MGRKTVASGGRRHAFKAVVERHAPARLPCSRLAGTAGAPREGPPMSDTSKRELAQKVIDRTVKAPLEDTRELLHRDGELKPGLGKISSVIALSLGILSLLGVLA